jgi:hypothetical protein
VAAGGYLLAGRFLFLNIPLQSPSMGRACYICLPPAATNNILMTEMATKALFGWP